MAGVVKRIRDMSDLPRSALVKARGGVQLSAKFDEGDIERIDKVRGIKRMTYPELIRFAVRRYLDEYGL